MAKTWTRTELLNLLATMPEMSKMEVIPRVVVKRFICGFSIGDGTIKRAEAVVDWIMEALEGDAVMADAWPAPGKAGA